MLSDKNREQLEKLEDVVSALRKAADAVDEFYQLELDYGRECGKLGGYLPLDNTRFEAICNLPVMLAKAGASLAEVVTGLADAKQARLARRAKVVAVAHSQRDDGGHGSLDRPGE